MTSLSIIGAGAWGTALAQCYASAGHDVCLWARTREAAESLSSTRRNVAHLDGVDLHPSIVFTNDLLEAATREMILHVVPAQHMRSNLELLAPLMRQDQILVLCAKGIEIATRQLPADVAAATCPSARIAVLTGPNFARDIARGGPAASTLASDPETGARVLQALTARNLRLYQTTDMVGAQIGGAIKNVIAIACGISQGLDLGESARAALVTRGLAEIARLAEALGGKRDTLLGQCGVGDIMLTCSSAQSRNFSCGLALAAGKTLDEIRAGGGGVTEGVSTARAAHDLAREKGVDMPVVTAIYKCLYEGLSIRAALDEILDRPPRGEGE